MSGLCLIPANFGGGTHTDTDSGMEDKSQTQLLRRPTLLSKGRMCDHVPHISVFISKHRLIWREWGGRDGALTSGGMRAPSFTEFPSTVMWYT